MGLGLGTALVVGQTASTVAAAGAAAAPYVAAAGTLLSVASQRSAGKTAAKEAELSAQAGEMKENEDGTFTFSYTPKPVPRVKSYPVVPPIYSDQQAPQYLYIPQYQDYYYPDLGNYYYDGGNYLMGNEFYYFGDTYSFGTDGSYCFTAGNIIMCN